jgi:hypothetical protein
MYVASNGSGSTPVYFLGEARTAKADVQLGDTTPVAEAWLFGASLATPVEITSKASRAAADGAYVCHRGAGSGHSCGTVTAINYAPMWSGACPSTTCSATWILVEGSSLKCYPGDSGGPFYLGPKAYGFYKGQSSDGTTAAGCYYAIFMSQQYLTEFSAATKIYIE